MKNQPKTRERCHQCGFKIRGKNHKKGHHHKVGRHDGRAAVTR